MKTQLELAREGMITDAMREAAAYDDVSPEFIREGIARDILLSMETRIEKRVLLVLVRDLRQR